MTFSTNYSSGQTRPETLEPSVHPNSSDFARGPNTQTEGITDLAVSYLNELVNMLGDLWTEKPSLSTPKPNLSAIGPVTEVVKGVVYGAEATTVSGEIFYFGMERLDSKDASNRWRVYRNACQRLNYHCRGTLIYLGSLLEDPQNTEKLAEFSKSEFNGLDDEAFSTLVTKMRDRGIYIKGRKWKAFEGIAIGITGFICSKDDSRFVAYASKTPIKGRISTPTEFSEQSLKKISATYNHIIMSVGVSLLPGRPAYHNRGIFRNPPQFH